MVLPKPSQILNSIVALPDCPAASAANALPITSSMVPSKRSKTLQTVSPDPSNLSHAQPLLPHIPCLPVPAWFP
ncbi:hypothetical protein PtA15_2A626 [Puccinia triticina]|uniref:Uncharacterized protein n=1 Tax=Puccinia triticina TaxID=208348 RepID=A0ABY7CBB1_9BASI|nr:uncharacterized protein PtA15_2A626 [Puccinia triticina]WAQ82309.1 hypothetical protein PtA15_2A626 [Puccinia triticina]